MSLDAELLALIVCPACHADLVEQAGPSAGSTGELAELVCRGCGLAYPIQDGIPVLLVDEARRPA